MSERIQVQGDGSLRIKLRLPIQIDGQKRDTVVCKPLTMGDYRHLPNDDAPNQEQAFYLLEKCCGLFDIEAEALQVNDMLDIQRAIAENFILPENREKEKRKDDQKPGDRTGRASTRLKKSTD